MLEHRVRAAAVAGLALLALGAAVACGDDDNSTSGNSGSSADQQAIETTIRNWEKAEHDGDGNAYLANTTDNYIKTTFGVFGVTADDIKKDPSIIQDSDPGAVIDGIRVAGSTATVDAEIPAATDNNPSNAIVVAKLVKQGGQWKVDSTGPRTLSTKPSGAKTVNVEMQEFTFKFNAGDFKSGSTYVIHGKNTGKQTHMIEMAMIPANANLDDLLQYQGDGPPPGVTDIANGTIFPTNSEGDIVLTSPLKPGRYVFLCFLPDTSEGEGFGGTPHFMKGMKADFTVQ